MRLVRASCLGITYCFALFSSLGCAVVAPPPLMSQLAGTAPSAPGDMRIMIAVGVGGNLLGGKGFGGEIRFERQLTEWATVGAGLGGGYNTDTTEATLRKHQPQWIYALRSWGRFNPAAINWFAGTTGVGITGTNNGTVALTFDGSTAFGGVVELNEAPPGKAFRISPYGGPVGAISIPLRQGIPIEKSKFLIGFGPDARAANIPKPVPFATTYFWGFQFGTAVDSGRVPAWTGAVELTVLNAISAADSTALFSLATGQGARIRR